MITTPNLRELEQERAYLLALPYLDESQRDRLRQIRQAIPLLWDEARLGKSAPVPVAKKPRFGGVTVDRKVIRGIENQGHCARCAGTRAFVKAGKRAEIQYWRCTSCNSVYSGGGLKLEEIRWEAAS